MKPRRRSEEHLLQEEPCHTLMTQCVVFLGRIFASGVYLLHACASAHTGAYVYNVLQGAFPPWIALLLTLVPFGLGLCTLFGIFHSRTLPFCMPIGVNDKKGVSNVGDTSAGVCDEISLHTPVDSIRN